MSDKTRLQPLSNSVHPIPHGAKAVRRTPGQNWLELTLGVRRAKPLPALTNLDSTKPAKRTYMTRKQLGDEYGSDPKAVADIETYAKAHSLIVTRDQRGAGRLTLGGTVADLSEAFGVTLFDYSHAELGEFHARTGPVQVPAELVGAITGVFGFNNHRILRRKLHAGEKSPDMAAKARAWFLPTELVPVYEFPAAGATNQCIGLLEFGGGVEQKDVTSYFNTIKQPRRR